MMNKERFYNGLMALNCANCYEVEEKTKDYDVARKKFIECTEERLKEVIEIFS